VIVRAAVALLDAAVRRRVRVRRLSVTLDLAPAAAARLDLFGEPAEGRRERALTRTLDAVRGRFGWEALRRGAVSP
jgi:hypothetical protein